MKKAVVFLLTSAMVLTSLAGCGTTNGQSANGESGAAGADGAGKTIKMITWSNAGTVDALKELNEKFKAETGITVELTEVPSSDYESLLNTRLAANDVDIFCYTTDSRAFAQPVVDWHLQIH